MKSGDPVIKTLLLTGQSSQWHNWKISRAALESLLLKAGSFEVDVLTTPESGGDFSGFDPDWETYDVVVLDYEGDDWPEATRERFADYVCKGGGVVIYHATNNGFPRWPEFNEMIGVGGWGERDESVGPKLRWRNGEIVRDNTPGLAMHPDPFAFQVTTRASEHPIMNGLPERWLHATDELYSQLRGPAKNVEVLATAIADPSVVENGTGEHEPVLMTIGFGEGRVFHTTLGHVGVKDRETPDCLKCIGFSETFLRGVEWAATGKVTRTAPERMPEKDQVALG